MVKKGRKGKKEKQVPEPPPVPSADKIPRSFIFAKPGKVRREVQQLVQDFRQVMMPNTAPNLKVTKRNVMKDFLNVAGQLGVTHLLYFTATDNGNYLRMARLPRGPTLTFRVESFSLMRDLTNVLANPHGAKADYRESPLVILNNFTDEVPQVKLAKSMFQHLFPALDIRTARAEACKRVVLLNRDPEADAIEMRHYHIKMRPVGLSRPLHEVVEKARTLDLSHFRDAADFVEGRTEGTGAGDATADAVPDAAEDEYEEDDVLPSVDAPNVPKKPKTAVSLVELGPRVRLQLVKVEEGYFTGEVIYHRYVQRTPEEIAEQRRMVQQRQKEREARRKQQEENVRRKEELRAERRAAAQAKAATSKTSGGGVEENGEGDAGEGRSDGDGASRADGGEGDEEHVGPDDDVEGYFGGAEDDIDDDVRWYRAETGEEPTQEDMATLARAHDPATQAKELRRPRYGKKSARGSHSADSTAETAEDASPPAKAAASASFFTAGSKKAPGGGSRAGIKHGRGRPGATVVAAGRGGEDDEDKPTKRPKRRASKGARGGSKRA